MRTLSEITDASSAVDGVEAQFSNSNKCMPTTQCCYSHPRVMQHLAYPALVQPLLHSAWKFHGRRQSYKTWVSAPSPPTYQLVATRLTPWTVLFTWGACSYPLASAALTSNVASDLPHHDINHVVTVPDLERQTFNNCYEGPSLPGAGHVSPVRGGDMDIIGRRPEDSGSLSYEMPATDVRYPLDRQHQQRDCLITYRSRLSRRADC